MLGRPNDGVVRRMKSDGQRAQQRLKTRNAILDATEAIMREEGYAAVSSRKIAEKAGLKSQLVHYHFGNMDELFLALYRRSEDLFFTHMLKVLSSPDPMKKLWDLITTTEETTLVLEFTAIATHRKAFQEELVRSANRARSLENSVMAKAFGSKKLHTLKVTPNIMSFIIQSVSRAIVMERGVGITSGHDEVLEFIDALLKNWKPEADSD
jgi:AcrR family transcriptional regulator